MIVTYIRTGKLDRSVANLHFGEVALITDTGGCDRVSVGDVVIRGQGEVLYVHNGEMTCGLVNSDLAHHIQCRPLGPGEVVSFAGE